MFELRGHGLTGFMPPAMPDAARGLNAMYEHEHEHGSGDVSHHEYRQARLADGSTPRDIIAGIDLDAVGVAMGGGPGRAEHPGPGWRRLRWAELARRTGDPIVLDGLMPCFRCFPSATKNGSWPLGIVPPTEGSLRAGRLGDAEILYDMPEADLADFSPANLWAEDRSWVLCTDYDLWATKVAGPPALIEALLNDPGVEAVRLPWAT
ncbi:hypothetical protein IPZ70_19105 [Streptomyces polychromogenes]|nr:hypothetical protein [Streptomyces polychromogenes]